MAALIGLLAVLAFMAFYYRFSGLVADVALVLNGLVVLAIMAAINSTLTLPGIAGFVLTLGMAVDANVLINERIREELKTGRSIGAALKTGYDKVFWTIFDGHVTALVAGFVIRAYGSGPVRGFATTLIIGLLASMFTSIVVTRAIVEWFVSHGRLHKAVSF
jgi:preprotein translocase subunit SecD